MDNQTSIFCKLEKKYRPRKIEDIIGNKFAINKIKKWLENYETNKIKQMNNPKKRKKIIIKKEDEDELENDSETENENEFIPEEDFVETEEELNKKTLDNPLVAKKKTEKIDDELYSCLLVMGNHGSGKSSSVSAILNSLKYDVKKINLNKISSSKKLNKISNNKKNDNFIDEYVTKLIKGDHIYDKLLYNTDKKKTDSKKIKKTAIIIDRVETSALPAEKKIITSILKINEKKWSMPIIFITNIKHSKILTFLKSNTYNVEFQSPSTKQLYDLLLNICKKEGITMQKEDEGGKLTAEKIIEYSQNDYRKLFSILQELTIFNKYITLNDIENYCAYSKKKDTDVNIFTATSQMMTLYDSISECMRLYNSDRVTYPLMMQQNYPMFINNCCKSNDIKTYEAMVDIADSMAKGDLIENYIFSDQNWDMVEVHGFYSCVKTAYTLSNINYRGSKEYVMSQLEYPKDFNRTTIKQINRRNVNNSAEYLSNFAIQDFINAGEMLKKLIEDNRIEEAANILKPYGINEKILDSILKINKIIEAKSSFLPQTKRKFAEILNPEKQKKNKKNIKE